MTERLYHEIACPSLTKTGPCNCAPVIVADSPSSVSVSPAQENRHEKTTGEVQAHTNGDDHRPLRRVDESVPPVREGSKEIPRNLTGVSPAQAREKEIFDALKAVVEMYGPSTDYDGRAAAVWRRAEAALAASQGSTPAVIADVAKEMRESASRRASNAWGEYAVATEARTVNQWADRLASLLPPEKT